LECIYRAQRRNAELVEVFKLKGLDLSQSSVEAYERKFQVFEVVLMSKHYAMQTYEKWAPKSTQNNAVIHLLQNILLIEG
jgi:hypothetical protein